MTTRLRREGRYEPALDQLRESIRQDPGHTEPELLLPTVLKEAAHWRYTLAVTSADNGNLDLAREHLERSLRHDLSDEASAYAMASLTPDALDPATPGLGAYREGLTQSAEGRWAQAEQSLLQSVGANSGLLPSRAALFEARAQLAESRRLQHDGQARIDQLSMGPAIESLNQSLDTWPYNTQASELLTKAKAQRGLADKQFVQATQAAGQADWDDAIALVDSGLAIDRSHPALGELRSALPRRAAADHAHRGDGHLENGELGEAHRAYSRALSYRETSREARLGMTYVYSAWGKDQEQAGRLGAARLSYAKGQSYTRSKMLDEGVLRMDAALRDRLGVGLSVSASEQGRGAVDPKQLSGALLDTLEGKQSRGLVLQGEGMPYELRLSISKATIDERLTNTSRRKQHYTTEELRHNPEHDRVLAKLKSAERDYDRACRAYNNATGKDPSKHNRQHDAKHNHHMNNINSARSRVDRLRRELSRTPRQIKVTLHHDWHYTVETYTKTGELKVVTELIDTTSGKAVKAFTHQASFAQSDDRTLNANPSVGVRVDDLKLYRDDYVRGALADELASAAGPWAVNALVDHRLAQLRATIGALEDEGKTEEALEARVDAAVLLGIVDRRGSQHALDKLTQSHTR